MADVEQKRKVLAAIARALHGKHVVWAVGGSLLLYFKGKTDDFQDIDLMVSEEHAETMKEALLSMGTLAPPAPNPGYKTRHFLQFTICGVEVDVMGGMVIVKDGKDYDCSLSPAQVAEYVLVDGEQIPLQSLEDWRRYYLLMGREDKVAMIDR